MDNQSFLPWLVPLLPLLGFMFNAFFGARLTASPATVGHDPHSAGEDGHDGADGASTAHSHGAGGHGAKTPPGLSLVGGIATAAIWASFAVALMLFFQVQSAPEHRLFSTPFDWMQVAPQFGLPGLDLKFSLCVDPLSALMLLIITGIGALIHGYSMGYMAHEKGYARYFTYLNLFVFFMLLLVMSSNFIGMFVGWEGVGLASYLLIGFYSERKSATDAGKKAFIVNRIGDAALLIALYILYVHFGTFEYFGPNGILTKAGLDNAMGIGYESLATLVPILLLAGAAGKSAQIPLYVWLPDAMEGPTPVSALIHAATMVTAGVYLLTRAHSLFLLSPTAMTVVAVIGVSTAFLAATIALVQNDIKKVLAYSTVSQLGYMFLACGVGAFDVAMFHVTTHAFFKALLFLGAGSVIHAMGGEQDMRKMGGLASKIPTTYRTMLIATLAIAGIPPLAGFWSKDEILLNAFAGPSMNGLGHPLLWLVGFITSGMTAFYMVRLMMKTFAGAPRHSDEVAAHVHESPPSMTIPLLALAGLSIIGGFLNATPLGLHFLSRFLGETAEWREAAGKPLEAGNMALILLVASALLAAVVSFLAFSTYKKARRGELLTPAAKDRSLPYQLLWGKWGVDEIYDAGFVAPGRRFARGLFRVADRRMFDGVVNTVARAVTGLSSGLSPLQSGFVRSYALTLLLGVVLILAITLLGFGRAMAR